jgi:hypothetical protein
LTRLAAADFLLIAAGREPLLQVDPGSLSSARMDAQQRFSGAAIGRQGGRRVSRQLDPDGCLVRFGSQPAREKTGAVKSLQE